MAFLEGKLQMIDLVSALEAQRRRKEQEEQSRNAYGLAQPKPNWMGGEVESNPYLVFNPMPGVNPGMNIPGEKQFLSQTPGYISGVSPTDVFKERMATGRSLMDAASRGGYGGQGAETESDIALKMAQAGLAGEQERSAQYKRQGYGSATEEQLTREKIASLLEGDRARAAGGVREAEIKEFGKGYDELNKERKTNEKQTAKEIATGDKALEKTKEDVGKLALYQNKSFSDIKGLDPQRATRIELAFPQFYKQVISNGVPPTENMISDWITRYFSK